MGKQATKDRKTVKNEWKLSKKEKVSKKRESFQKIRKQATKDRKTAKNDGESERDPTHDRANSDYSKCNKRKATLPAPRVHNPKISPKPRSLARRLPD